MSDLFQMIGFRAGDRVEAQVRQAAAAPGVLAARPAERGVQIIGAVHEDGARLNLLPDGGGGVVILRPDAGGQAIGRVVHQTDRLGIVGDLHDADHRAERLFGHYFHGVVNVGQYGRLKEVTTIINALAAQQQLSTFRFGIFYLGFQYGQLVFTGQGSQENTFFGRLAQFVAGGFFYKGIHKRIVNILVNIDTLNSAAALAIVDEMECVK